jgi:murein DD-endopeptidase MepM/ murein hydrolase activator NlpD
MRSRVVACSSRKILRFVAAGLLAGGSAACSDSSRFSSSPFTNPFSAAPTAKVDKVTTGSLPSRSAPIGAVTSQPLPSALPGAGVSNPLNPAQKAGTAAAVATPRVASQALQNASPIGGSAAGWTAAGGTPVTVGAGETASTLSARYGVPVAAITAANGGALKPGQQAIIPVYAGNAGGQPKSGLMQPQAKPVAQAPVPPASVQPSAAQTAPSAPESTAELKAAASRPAAKPAAAKAAAVPLPPQRPTAAAQPTLRQAAKPIVPAKPAPAAKADDDDDDEDEAPKKIIAAAPKATAPQRVAQAAEKPASKPVQQAQAPQQARPQPRVIPMTQQATQETHRAPAETPKAPAADPVTTQSIPTTPKAAEPAGDKPDFRWPAKGRVISGFGSKGGNGDGIAIAVPEGTSVKAADGGTVAYAGEELKGYGKLVLVRHDNGYVSAYAHNGELNVKRGDKVARGQTIAKSGATGNVTSPQLHFELRKGSTPVDPTKYLEN